MPIAAKLIAALALTGAVAAIVFVQANPEVLNGIRFVGTNALDGFLLGVIFAW